MKTVLIVYMPGHAGNFLIRLFGLSSTVMPILQIAELETLICNWTSISKNFNKLEKYKFSDVGEKYTGWQEFHRSYADYLNAPQYRILNFISGQQFDYIYAIHPYEFVKVFVPVEDTEIYHVELDASYDLWVESEQRRLDFATRRGEALMFNDIKTNHSTKPISLTQLLGSDSEFLHEYNRVCNQMNIVPVPDQALILLNDWKSVRKPTRSL